MVRAFPSASNTVPPPATARPLLADPVTCVQTALLLLPAARAPTWFRFGAAMCSVMAGSSRSSSGASVVGQSYHGIPVLLGQQLIWGCAGNLT